MASPRPDAQRPDGPAAERTEALLLGGRSGTGKTSVGYEVHAQLSAAGIRHCIVDGDNLDMAYPDPREHGLAERNLAAIWANYRALGYRRVVYTNTASVLSEVTTALTAAMGDRPRVTAILLTCTDATARQRLAQRETGSELTVHIERSDRMARRLEASAPDSVRRVATDGRSVTEIAAGVIALAGWAAADQGADRPAGPVPRR
ncbi:MAG TPA: adenylyl-sulfate kinase [Streptosporangiaceae bacterium]